jgi:hypothetical protein
MARRSRAPSPMRCQDFRAPSLSSCCASDASGRFASVDISLRSRQRLDLTQRAKLHDFSCQSSGLTRPGILSLEPR